MQLCVTFYTVIHVFCVFTTVNPVRVVPTLGTYCQLIVMVYRDFLILILPKIAIIIPITRTAPNSRMPLSAMVLPWINKITPVPAIIKPPPIIIKIPNFFDGSFLVIKKEIISMAAGMPPNIEPLILGSNCKNPDFSFPADMTSAPYSASMAIEMIDIIIPAFNAMLMANFFN